MKTKNLFSMHVHPMRAVPAFAGLIVASVVLLSSLFSSVARADLKIVATVPMLGAIAQEIGGASVQVKTLALPTQDPHFVDAKPSLALDLNRADMLLAVGLELEAGWLPVLQKGARNPKILGGGTGYFEASPHVALLERPTTVDRSQGDIHPGGSPHFLYDPRAVRRVAAALATRMAEIDPEHAPAFRANAEAFDRTLSARTVEWSGALAPLKGQPFVAYHASWSYLADWLGLRLVGVLEPKPGIPPNPAHVAQVIARSRTEKVRLVTQETYYPDATARLVADKIGAKLVSLPGGPSNGQSVAMYFDAIVATLKAVGP